MACPVCSHTMQTIIVDPVVKRYWCPRCGTIKNEIKHKATVEDVGGDLAKSIPERIEEVIEMPMLVKRCRQFEPTLPRNTFGEVWIQMGVAEAIQPPESRMK